MVSDFHLLPAQVRTGRQEAAAAQGDGWLLPPNPSPPDTSPEDLAWITPRRRWQPIGTFAQPIALKRSGAMPPRAYIYCTRITPEPNERRKLRHKLRGSRRSRTSSSTAG